MRRYWAYFYPIALSAIVIGLLCWGWSYLQRSTTLPFHRIRLIYSGQHIDTKHISQLAWSNIEGGFFSLNVAKLKKAFMNQPWLEDVSIRREWPDTLALSIEEKHPEARWGAKGLISTQGEIFYPSSDSIPKDLPLIDAPDSEEKEILTDFHKLNDDAQRLTLHITNLEVSDRDMYQMTLSNGVVVMIGRDDVLQRFHHFVDLYSKIIGDKSDSVVGVDLRYPNGLAIKWKSDP